MKVGIALSGGGIRGIAHAGVLKGLEENNIKIDIIGGTSSGSMIASLYAMGYSPYYIYILFKKYAKKMIEINTGPIISGIRNILINKKLSISGLKTGKSIETIFNEVALKKGIKTIENIKMPIVIPTVDLADSKEYIFTNIKPEDNEQYITDISVGKAVRASSSFTGIYSPCEYRKHLFIDGGALDNIPVHEVKKQGADKVIAVKFHSDEVDNESNVMDVTMKTIDIMGSKISEEGLEESDLVLDVYTDKTGLLDVQKLDSCYKYGYQCVINNISNIKEILKNRVNFLNCEYIS